MNMALSQEVIDTIVAKGAPLGKIGLQEAFPQFVGDWNLRLVTSRGVSAEGTLVAVPTNSRTRCIYNEGRRAWLRSLGFNDHQVEDYMKASGQIMYRWEDLVAKFVLAYENMSVEMWEDIFHDKYPRRRAEELGLACQGMTQPRLLAAMQILTNIWELP